MCHPTEHACVISSAQGNNEISMWNLETGFREKVLWGSQSPPLSKTHVSIQKENYKSITFLLFQVTNHSVCAMQAGCIDRSGFLLAGGSDQRLRFWDLENPRDSYLAVPAPNDITTTHTYKNRLIDGTCVIYEVVDVINMRSAGKGDEVPRAGPEPPSPGHRDCICDIALCKASQCFMVTASRDGVVKVWK